jgi:hypothetical protein
MKIQSSRFAAIASALSLVVTGLVGVQSANAASIYVRSGDVSIAITDANAFGATATITHPTYSGSPGFRVADYYACDTANTTANVEVTKAYVDGNADWVLPNPSTIGTATGCVPLSNGSLSPSRSGKHIVAGSRTPENGGFYYIYFSTSILYTHVEPQMMPQFPIVNPLSVDISAGSNPGDTVVASTLDTWAKDGVDGHTVTAGWAYFTGCNTGPSNQPQSFSLTNGGAMVAMDSSRNLTIPSEIYVKATPTSPNFTSRIDLTVGSHYLAAGSTISKSGFITSTRFSTVFEVGGTVCASGGVTPTASTPYAGPIVTPPAAVSFRPGAKAVLPGSNLSGVSKVSVAGLDANVKVNSAGEIEITVPSSLKPGVYDLVIVSDSGTLTVQDGLRVASGSSSVGATSEARPSTKLKEDNTVKVHVFDVVGAGKVQIFVNGKEIAWVNATDANDSKLLNGYLVRTVELAEGKNVIEVFVGGERVGRKAYTN